MTIDHAELPATNETLPLPPILGGFDLTDQARYVDGVPYDVFARLRREAPVFFHPPGRSSPGEGFWVLSRHADIAAAASDPVFSAQGGGGRLSGGTHLEDLPVGGLPGVVFFMMDDPRHELMRDLFGPRLRGHAADRLAGELAGRARALVTGALERGGGDFVTGVAQPFAVQSIALLMGVPEQDWDRLTAWVHEVLGFTNRRTGQPDEHSRKTFQAMHDYFRSFVAGKRDNPADDLGSLLACGEIAADRGEPPLRDHEREMNATVLVVSGVEQPRNTIAAGVLALAEHPEQWRALRADRSLLPSAIEEILRWTPANPYNRRTATRDVDLHGVRIRAGDKVTLWWPSANRDETVFDAPDRFDIRRNPNPHLSFGAGLHACVGDQVGRVEIRQILTELLDRVAHLRLTGPPRWAPNNKHTVLLDLPIELVPA